MTLLHPIVFLVDVDNTLLDNDGIQQDLKDHLERAYGRAARERYWRILEDLFVGAGLSRLHRRPPALPRRTPAKSSCCRCPPSSWTTRSPTGSIPSALEVLKRLRSLGPTVILSDGDVVFQPRKVEHAGIADAVDGHVLIYIHKEEALDDVERRYPAEHYVLVDDKLRILTRSSKSGASA